MKKPGHKGSFISPAASRMKTRSMSVDTGLRLAKKPEEEEESFEVEEESEEEEKKEDTESPSSHS